MTLFRLLLLGLFLLVSCLSGSSLWLYLRGSQDYLNERLTVHAQDTATSLGLSLSSVLEQQDWVLASSMVDAIFDSGQYQQITLEDMQGNVRKARSDETIEASTPKWFQRLFPLAGPVMETQVNGQWRLVARLKVQASPGPAQAHLWRITQQAFFIALALILLALISGAQVLKRILQPLEAARRQAEGIRKRHYLRQAELPRIRELRSLVLAMNQMVTSSENLFQQQCRRVERLQQQRLIDPDTGLGNLTQARQQLEQALKDREQDGGMLVRIHLVGLDRVELKQGVDGEQALLRQMADILSQTSLSHPRAQVFRIGFGDFLLLLPGCRSQDIAHWQEEVGQRLLVLLRQGGGQRVLIVTTPYQFDEPEAVLESALDQLMTEALGRPEPVLYLVGDADHRSVQTQEQQLALVQKLLNNTPKLLNQDVQKTDGTLLYREILARFFDGEKWHHPGPVMVLVNRQQKHQQLDVLVAETLVNWLAANRTSVRMALNLSVESVLDLTVVEALIRVTRTYTHRLAFEVPEQAFLIEPEQTQQCIQKFCDAGAEVWLDHVSPSGLPLLRAYGLTGVKLDPSYTSSLGDDDGSLVALMATAAHARGLLVVAEQVETESLGQQLLKLGVDGVQGFGIVPPGPLVSDPDA